MALRKPKEKPAESKAPEAPKEAPKPKVTKAPKAPAPKAPASGGVTVCTTQTGLWNDCIMVQGAKYEIDTAGFAEMSEEHAKRMCAGPGWRRAGPSDLKRREGLLNAAAKRQAAAEAAEQAKRAAIVAEQKAKAAAAEAAAAGKE